MKIVHLVIGLLFVSLITNGQTDTNVKQTQERGLLRNQMLKVSGMNRFYHLYLPDMPKKAPLVLLLHGNRSSHTKLLGLNRGKAPYKIWLDIAKRENIIIAVPNGVRGSQKHRGWNDCRNDVQTNPKLDDVLFISTLIDVIVNTYDADIAKVYVMGTSNGGHMALRLAHEIPEKLTAFAAVVAANPVNSKCRNSDLPISALFMNGTADPILPFEGGQMASKRGEVQSSENTVAYWMKRNNTDKTPMTSLLADGPIFDKSTIEKRTFKNGKNKTEVVFYKVNNGGHTEPSKRERYRKFFLKIVGSQNADIEMAEEIWSFFKTKMKT